MFQRAKHVLLHFRAIRKSTHKSLQSIHNINANINLFLNCSEKNMEYSSNQDTREALLDERLPTCLTQDSFANYEQKPRLTKLILQFCISRWYRVLSQLQTCTLKCGHRSQSRKHDNRAIKEEMVKGEGTASMAVVKRAEIVGCGNKPRFDCTPVQSFCS